MATPIYKSLDVSLKQVRLVHLRPATDRHHDLVAELEVVSLLGDSIPDFRALSYVCGSFEDLLPMQLSGTQIFIYSNLDSALRDVRRREETLTLWIDQLSINQQDPTERAQQVRLMSAIYPTATEVLVYLNPEPPVQGPQASERGERNVCERAASVYNTISELGKLRRSEHYTGSIALGETWEDVLNFYVNDYWHRIWTTQEFALAKTVTFLYGSYTLSEALVHSFWTWYDGHLWKKDCCHVGNKHATESAISRGSSAYSFTRHLRLRLRAQPQLSLLQSLALTHEKRALVPHDKIFALAGLVDIPAEILDYMATEPATYEAATVYMVQSMATLDVLSQLCCGLPLSSIAPHQYLTTRLPNTRVDRLPGLASWSPDWAQASTGVGNMERQIVYPFYSASGSSDPSIRVSGSKLHVSGVRCGTVVKVGLCHEYPLCELYTYMFERWAEIADVSSSEPKVPGTQPSELFIRFMSVLTGGFSLRNSGDVFKMKTDEDHLYHVRLTTHWWHTRMKRDLSMMSSSPDLFDRNVIYNDRSAEFPKLEDDEFTLLVQATCYNRRFTILEDGSFGWAQHAVRPGDTVCIFQGGRIPFIIGLGKRTWNLDIPEEKHDGHGPLAQKGEQAMNGEICYQLLGDAYVEGLMDGSAFAAAEANLEEFTLV